MSVKIHNLLGEPIPLGTYVDLELVKYTEVQDIASLCPSFRPDLSLDEFASFMKRCVDAMKREYLMGKYTNNYRKLHGMPKRRKFRKGV